MARKKRSGKRKTKALTRYRKRCRKVKCKKGHLKYPTKTRCCKKR